MQLPLFHFARTEANVHCSGCLDQLKCRKSTLHLQHTWLVVLNQPWIRSKDLKIAKSALHQAFSNLWVQVKFGASLRCKPRSNSVLEVRGWIATTSWSLDTDNWISYWTYYERCNLEEQLHYNLKRYDRPGNFWTRQRNLHVLNSPCSLRSKIYGQARSSTKDYQWNWFCRTAHFKPEGFPLLWSLRTTNWNGIIRKYNGQTTFVGLGWTWSNK